MAKWLVPDQKVFTVQAKIARAMQKHHLSVDQVLEAIEMYADDNQFESSINKVYNKDTT
tara:strand:+ start:901 stop:1077 length:177 start_codon:yes stop_codon:yes gene_type:complete